jgi:hypothetical protein
MRLLLAACSIATIVPNIEVQLAATVVGIAVLVLTQLRGRTAKINVSA